MRTAFNTALAASVAVVAALPVEPTSDILFSRSQNMVQVLSSDVQGPDINSLHHAPANISSSLRSFLEKYQPLAESASNYIGAKQQARFTSAGHCFAEFPCFSVERGGMVTIGDQEEVTQAQVSAILDHLTSSATIDYDYNPSTALSGFKLSLGGATLEAIAAQGSVPANLLAGMVFDMYKMQHDDPSTNSIRAVQAKTDDKERPFVALCLYPDGSDATQAHNFCLGNELDGSLMLATSSKAKRFSIEHGLNFLCGLIKIPIICHENE